VHEYNRSLGFKFELEAHGFDKGHALFGHDVACVECISDFGKMKGLDLKSSDSMNKNGSIFLRRLNAREKTRLGRRLQQAPAQS
jgi:hypothetical protein